MSFRPRDVIATLFVLSLLSLMQIGHFLVYNPLVSGPDGDPVANYFTTAPYLFTAACVIAGVWRNSGTLALSGMVPFVPFLLLCALSVAWSVDIGATFRSVFLLTAFLLAVSTTVRAVGAAATSTIVTHILGLAMVGSALLALAVPQIGQHNLDDLIQSEHFGSWRGLFAHKNSLGLYAAFALIFALAFRGRVSRWVFPAYVGAASACLYFSNSTTSLIAAAVGVLSLYIAVPLYRKAPPYLALAGMLALLVVAGALVVAATLLGWTGATLFEGTKAETLTGRTEIWGVAFDIFLSQPLLGVGFGAGSLFARPVLQEMTFMEAVDPHSGYLALLLDLGIVGVPLFLMPVVLALLKFGRAPTAIDGNGVTLVSVVFMSLTAAITEVSPFLVQGSAGFFFYFALVLLQLGREATPTLQPGANENGKREGPRPLEHVGGE